MNGRRLKALRRAFVAIRGVSPSKGEAGSSEEGLWGGGEVPTVDIFGRLKKKIIKPFQWAKRLVVPDPEKPSTWRRLKAAYHKTHDVNQAVKLVTREE